MFNVQMPNCHMLVLHLAHYFCRGSVALGCNWGPQELQCGPGSAGM